MKDIRKNIQPTEEQMPQKKIEETKGEVGARNDTFPAAFYDKQPPPPFNLCPTKHSRSNILNVLFLSTTVYCRGVTYFWALDWAVLTTR
jgi:hypothetical protein